MRDLFSEDAVWESDGFGVFRGRAQILAGLREIARTRVSHTSHYMIAPLVDVGSDRRSARASWRLWELAHLRDGTGSKFHQVMAGGDYTCKLLRIDGKWRLQHVRLNISTVVRCSAIQQQARGRNRGGDPTSPGQIPASRTASPASYSDRDALSTPHSPSDGCVEIHEIQGGLRCTANYQPASAFSEVAQLPKGASPSNGQYCQWMGAVAFPSFIPVLAVDKAIGCGCS